MKRIALILALLVAPVLVGCGDSGPTVEKKPSGPLPPKNPTADDGSINTD